jgi:hypothetical protein
MLQMFPLFTQLIPLEQVVFRSCQRFGDKIIQIEALEVGGQDFDGVVVILH